MTDKPVTERIDDGTRDAVNDFFDALSKWRDEVASSTERYSETVLAKMVPAVTAMGWPKEAVEASRASRRPPCLFFSKENAGIL